MADDRTRSSRTKGSAGLRSDPRREAQSRVEQLVKAVGNQEIAKRIAAGDSTRDQMLALVAERLGIVRELQIRELALTRRGAGWEWGPIAADSHRPSTREPDPTRWQAPARAYERAVVALCRGDLRQGEALLEEALRIEQETVEALTELVDTREIHRAGVPARGLFGALVAQAPSSGSCAEPTAFKALFDAILSVEQTVPDAPNRRRRRDPWWTLEDEEQEDEPDEGD